MKFYYSMNDKNQIVKDSYSPFDGAIEIDLSEYKVINGFDGRLYFESYTHTDEYQNRAVEYAKTQDLDELRRRREKECFAIVDRSKLWYDTLTSEQLAELKAWYNEWLKVTETKVIPTKPKWL